MKNTVIFDMDGVIIDSEPLNLDIIAELYDVIGIEVPEDFHLSSQGIASEEWWKIIQDKYHFNNYSIQELVEMERKKINDYLYSEECKKRIFNGVKESILRLKDSGYKLAVASASPYSVINQVLKVAGLEEVFDEVISATDKEIKRGKPYPDIFLYTAQKLDSLPEECLVIEDSERGLEAAKAADMKTVAFLSAPTPIKLDNADEKFENYPDLIEIVKSFK